ALHPDRHLGQRVGSKRAAVARRLPRAGDPRHRGHLRRRPALLVRGGRSAGRPRLALWLGSNVGNYEREEAATFLRRVRRTLGAADRLLVGVDLRKEGTVLEPAYDDAQGVTARFNKNLLVRINAELGGHFELEAFDH